MPVRSLSANGITWLHCTNPSEAELVDLQKTYRFHRLDIEDCLSEHERPKIEDYGTYLFFVFYFPWVDGKTSRLGKEEVNVFLGADFLITLAESEGSQVTAAWDAAKRSPKKRDEMLGQGAGYCFYRVLHDLFNRTFPLIDDIRRELRTIETRLFESEEDAKFFRQILLLKRNIITLRGIISPQRSLMPVLQHKNKTLLPGELGLYFDDIQDAVERQWALLDTAKEMSEALQDTQESWLGHKTNSIIRVLTIFSVSLLPLNVLTGLYGMNVHLPYQDNPEVFFALLGLMAAVLCAFFAYFVWKKWL
jgi:magnesium transporter